MQNEWMKTRLSVKASLYKWPGRTAGREEKMGIEQASKYTNIHRRRHLRFWPGAHS